MAIDDDDAVRNKFGELLISHRKKAKLSMRKLAAECNTDAADIGKYERAERNPTLTTIVDLARGLGISPSDLLQGLK